MMDVIIVIIVTIVITIVITIINTIIVIIINSNNYITTTTTLPLIPISGTVVGAKKKKRPDATRAKAAGIAPFMLHRLCISTAVMQHPYSTLLLCHKNYCRLPLHPHLPLPPHTCEGTSPISILAKTGSRHQVHPAERTLKRTLKRTLASVDSR